MAEFCLDCWNRINGTNDSPEKYIISKDLDLCEGCGEWKPVIEGFRNGYYIHHQSGLFKKLFKLFRK